MGKECCSDYDDSFGIACAVIGHGVQCSHIDIDHPERDGVFCDADFEGVCDVIGNGKRFRYCPGNA